MYYNLNFYCEHWLKIITKEDGLQLLRPNVFQKRLFDEINRQKALKIPIRIIILKPRQTGISTGSAAAVFHRCATAKYTRGMCIAHDNDSSKNIFNMHRHFYDLLPGAIRPLTRYSNAKELVFENPDDKTRGERPGLISRIEVDTAGNERAGRSGTVHCLHASELAFWEKAEVVKSSLFQSVPLSNNSMIICESTANGVSGNGAVFYDMWHDANENTANLQGGFVPIFFPWFYSPEYEFNAEGLIPTEEERVMMRTYSEITPKKLAWRRYKIANDLGGKVLDARDQFRQEYPACPQEAFIMSGRAVFDSEKILKHIESVKNVPHRTGYFDGEGHFYDDKKGQWKIYTPQRNNIAIGSDVAEGLETGDYSTGFVISNSGEQIASYHDHIAPDRLGNELCKAGRYFNNALIAVESNNHGLTTITRIRDNEYPNIYRKMVKDELSDKYTEKLGWNTNVKTKTQMLDDFCAAYRDGTITIYDIDLLKEMLTLVIEAGGDVRLNGKDRVVAACIALQARKVNHHEGTGVTHQYRDQQYIPNEFSLPTPEQAIKLANRAARNESNF